MRMSGVLMGGVDSSDAGWFLAGARLLLLLLFLQGGEQVSNQRGSQTTWAAEAKKVGRKGTVEAGGTHENFPAACLVTAAAIPLASLAFFLSFSGIWLAVVLENEVPG